MVLMLCTASLVMLSNVAFGGTTLSCFGGLHCLASINHWGEAVNFQVTHLFCGNKAAVTLVYGTKEHHMQHRGDLDEHRCSCNPATSPGCYRQNVESGTVAASLSIPAEATILKWKAMSWLNELQPGHLVTHQNHHGCSSG